jgi:hypothetical protein
MSARTRLVLALAAAGCGDKSEAPGPGQLASSIAQVAHAGSGGGSSLPPGWRREDLAGQGKLAASIAVPAEAKLVPSTELQRDADGLAIAIPIVTITGGGSSIKLSTEAVIGWVPTTMAADLADNARREKPFVVADKQETPTGEWAIAYRRDTQDCYVRGWSPRARVWCATAELEMSCTAIATPLEICTSLEPSGPPIAPAFDPGAAFPQVSDPEAAVAAVNVARAIARNDREALLSMVGPTGMMLKGKKVSPKALRALLATDTIQRAFEMRCKPVPGQRASQCAWTAESDARDNALSILASDGYGLVPRFTLTKGADGRWLLSNVDMADLGPP